ncbi:MAG TPA: hypothetical protein VGG72_11515 [Bryobacteraceae bacterium]|jgi:hypothetical protein
MKTSGEPDGAIVLGFDARHALDDRTFVAWDQDRRSQYLIRPEVPWPLSVDPMVWPAPTSETTNDNFLNLWPSAAAVFAAFPGETPVVIEIAVVPDPQSAGYWTRQMGGVVVQESAPSQYQTESLGYDVADRFLFSALSNGGFSEEKMAVIRSRCATRINSFGLFGDPAEAADLKIICDHSLEELAPFCVYRIRKITPLR